MRRYVKAVLALFVLSLLPLMTGATTADRRGYVAGKYALELDGVSAGWLMSAEGGNATSEVITEELGPEFFAKKHLAGVKYEDITITVGAGMSKAFYQWIQDTLDGKAPRKSGSIIATSFDRKELDRLTFYNALISEVTFPALDASSKDAAKMTIKISPERTRRTTGLSNQPVNIPVDTSTKQMWLPANFRLRIDGLDDAASRVNKIEALTVKQKVVEHSIGEMRDYETEPANLEIPNLVITTAESHADALYKWHEEFVIRGNNDETQEKTGTLEYLSPDLKTVLFRLTFRHLGIFRLTPDKVEAGGENIRRVKAEMYCEELSFSTGAPLDKAAPAAPAAPPVQPAPVTEIPQEITR